MFQIDVIFTRWHSTLESVVKIAQILTRDDKLIESSFPLEERKAWECVTLVDSLDVDTFKVQFLPEEVNAWDNIGISTSRVSMSVTHSQAFLSSKTNKDSMRSSSLLRICANVTTLSVNF